MRLLFLTETIPYPLDSGGRIKSYNTLRILSREHDVQCEALVRDAAQLEYEGELSRVCGGVTLHHVPRRPIDDVKTALISTITGAPFVLRRHFHRRVLDQLLDKVRKNRYDAVYCDHLSMLEYGRRLGLPIVLDAHNVEFEIVRRHARTLGLSAVRLFAEMEWRRLRRYEHRWYPACRLIFAVSDVDAETIRQFAGSSVPVVTVPIAVDLDAIPVRQGFVKEPEILFVGGLAWPPNADAVEYFIKDIFPTIREAVPAVRLTVVGSRPEAISPQLTQTPGIRLVGHVKDVEEYFSRSRVMVVPIRSGSGMRVKILDGLARELATVTTSVGCEGIDAVPETHILVGDTPAEFARHVTRVLSDDKLTSAIARSGRELIVEKYDVPAIARRLLDTFRAAFA